MGFRQLVLWVILWLLLIGVLYYINREVLNERIREVSNKIKVDNNEGEPK